MKIKHEFIERLPPLEEGTLYISIPFDLTAHLCFCGCGHKVITPITPTDWSIEYDGETVSLYPSIGSWNLPCKSHYYITRSEIKWMKGWSHDKIERGRKLDKKSKIQYFRKKNSEENE